MPAETVPHVTTDRMRQLIKARADRLAIVAAHPQATPALVARYVGQLLDMAIAFCGEDLGKAFYSRMLRDTRARAGLCLDCGQRPALKGSTFLLCASCQAAEDAAARQVHAELLLESSGEGRVQ
jgi:hypothetical protein